MSTKTPSRAILIGTALTGIAILSFLLWRQQSELARLKADNSDLKKQNLALLDGTLQTQPTAPAAPAVPATPAPAKQKVVDVSPVPHPSVSAKNRLVFTGTEVHQTATGLVATLRFKPAKTGPLGLVLMVARLPPDLEGRIQTIQPVGTAKYEDGESSISDDGRFAQFQGTLGDEKEVAIALGVSQSTRLFIKGSCGIPPLQVDIESTNAVAKPW